MAPFWQGSLKQKSSAERKILLIILSFEKWHNITKMTKYLNGIHFDFFGSVKKFYFSQNFVSQWEKIRLLYISSFTFLHCIINNIFVSFLFAYIYLSLTMFLILIIKLLLTLLSNWKKINNLLFQLCRIEVTLSTIFAVFVVYIYSLAPP